MGTRSLTEVYDEPWGRRKPRRLVTIYRQMDGYPDGIGREIADFLSDRTIVNGFGTNTPQKANNGMGCLAAQLVAHLKGDEIGSVYLYPPGSRDVGEEYIYTITINTDKKAGVLRPAGKLNLRCVSVGWKERPDVVVYDGPPEGFRDERTER